MCSGVQILTDVWIPLGLEPVPLSLLSHKESYLSGRRLQRPSGLRPFSLALKVTSFPAARNLYPQKDNNLEFCPGMFFLCSASFKVMQPKCRPGTSSMSITWELARNAESQAPPRSAESESTFSQNPQVIHIHIKV